MLNRTFNHILHEDTKELPVCELRGLKPLTGLQPLQSDYNVSDAAHAKRLLGDLDTESTVQVTPAAL